MRLKTIDKTIHLFILQLTMPFIALWAVFTHFSIPWLLVSAFVFFMMRCVGAVITYHRILGHRTHTMHPVVEFICTGFGFYGSFTSPIDFCSTHVNHHKYMDTENDPHSPKYLGWKACFPIFWKNRNSGDLRTILRLSKNKITMFYHNNYWILLFAPLLLLLISLEAFLFIFVVPAGLALFTLTISPLNHDENGPRNMGKIFGILTGGEHHHVWHHNHAMDTSGEGLINTIANLIACKRS